MKAVNVLSANSENRLADPLESSEIQYWKALYHTSDPLGSGFLELPGGIFACRVPGVDILAFNRVLGLGSGLPPDSAVLDRIHSFYQEKSIPRYFVQVNPFGSYKEQMVEKLQQNGFRLHNSWVKLRLDLQQENPLIENRIRVERIKKDKGKIYGDILTRAFEWPQQLGDLFAKTIEYPGYLNYLAYLDDQPIAAAALHIQGTHGSLAIAGTLPEFRSLGAQQKLMQQRLSDARRAGCHYLVSETAAELPDRPVPSYRNMLKMGFREMYQRPNYLYQDS
jgi:GNAT superfamily N-acetyltransferase